MKKWIVSILVVLFFSCSNGDNGKMYTGIIEGTAIKIPSLIGGKIVQMAVQVGDQIEEGSAIAQIDSVELGLQFQQANAQLLELAAQRAIAHSNLQRAETDLKYAAERRERVSRLVAQNSAPQQNLDDVENVVKKAKTGRDMAAQQLTALQAKQAQIDAQLQLLRKKLSDTTVLSPVSGFISSKYFENGEAVMPLAPLVEVVHLSTVKVKIYISAQMLPVVKLNQAVAIRADGLTGDMQGRISWISPKSEFSPKSILTPETRASLVYAVEIEIDNPDAVLKHGMPVEVVLE
ncbi:MAG: efflux RND transporter periplasmic adaptor subunit [Deferribacteres bacterium]|nr:efflux RND transporter periplasmic adaptor subunit [candidate division KSB1 bacterium]MCB9503547.1 efflux RND transporter periplasmic adaptor subunit [Deferribacteres bacterium]